MAYRQRRMWEALEVLEVLRRAQRGETHQVISRTTGRSHKTIRRYLTVAEGLGWRPGQVEPDEQLAAQVMARLRPGPRETSPGEAESILLPHRQQLRAWLRGDTDEVVVSP